VVIGEGEGCPAVSLSSARRKGGKEKEKTAADLLFGRRQRSGKSPRKGKTGRADGGLGAGQRKKKSAATERKQRKSIFGEGSSSAFIGGGRGREVDSTDIPLCAGRGQGGVRRRVLFIH